MNWLKPKVVEIEKIVYVEKSRRQSIENPPTNDEMRQWRSLKSGKFFLAGLQDELETIKDDIVNGLYTSETSDGTAQQMGKALGKCQQLEDVIETLEEFGTDEEKEDEG